MRYKIRHQLSIYKGAGFCLTCANEAFYQNSSSDMRDHYDTGIRFLPRVGDKKRHAVTVYSMRSLKSMCGQQKLEVS